MTKSRLEAFSDGVLAIIITIMVLELKIPHGADFKDLLQIWPVFLSYIVSFILIAIYWNNHHHLLHTIREVRSSIMWANMHLLFWLSLIPFATGWMGENHFQPLTIAVYAFIGNMCGVAYYILLITLRNCNKENMALMMVLNKQSRKGLASLFLYTAAMIFAFIYTPIAGGIIILIALMWLIPDRNIEGALKE
ncbi:MAG: DUF1211 domain-containing protein [Bacteroidetes bacterium]|nr:DUF1211 domain-containing protein [Bacteroidota bacterium]MBP9549661.1 DUF1211 domain-containing protein [Chitinophagales bacterium]MBP9705601.1 DUF1211 domain-containing protein [Chitinophagales bacterium]